MSWGCRGAENMEHTQSWSKINVHAPNFITTLHYIDSDSGVDTFESSGNPVENAPGVNWTILNLKKIRLRNCKKFHPQRLHVRAYPTHFFGKICFCATVHLNALGCRGQLHHYLWCPLLLVKKNMHPTVDLLWNLKKTALTKLHQLAYLKIFKSVTNLWWNPSRQSDTAMPASSEKTREKTWEKWGM